MLPQKRIAVLYHAADGRFGDVTCAAGHLEAALAPKRLMVIGFRVKRLYYYWDSYVLYMRRAKAIAIIIERRV